MPDPVVKRLLDILDRERTALTDGDFVALEPLGLAKEQAQTVLAKRQVTPQDVELLALRTTQNQALLRAAIAGVGAARESVEMLRRAGQQSVVYGKDGKTSRLSSTVQRFSQKL